MAMLRFGVGLAAALVLLSRGWAGDPPQGPPPQVKLAQPGKEGRGFLTNTVYETVPTTQTVKTRIDGQEKVRTVTVNVQVAKTVVVNLDDAGVEVSGVDGKRVDPKQLRLSGPTAVLVSADGRPVDPLYLRLAREGTLVVVARQLVPANLPPRFPPPQEILPPPKKEPKQP